MIFFRDLTKNNHHYQEFFFDGFIILSYSLYVLLSIGLIDKYPTFFDYLSNFIHVYLSFFIIIRFNPFVKFKCSNLDRKIIFSCGLLIFTTFVLTKVNINKIKKIISKIYVNIKK
jgi:uncharacterized membrane protein (DUF485 family)